jgi:hypothetical protein
MWPLAALYNPEGSERQVNILVSLQSSLDFIEDQIHDLPGCPVTTASADKYQSQGIVSANPLLDGLPLYALAHISASTTSTPQSCFSGPRAIQPGSPNFGTIWW